MSNEHTVQVFPGVILCGSFQALLHDRRVDGLIDILGVTPAAATSTSSSSSCTARGV
jgi:hypothetical protein